MMVTMWRLKACPRCSGDVYIAEDMYGWFEQCLQCAYKRELKNLGAFKKQPAEKKEPAGTRNTAKK